MVASSPDQTLSGRTLLYSALQPVRWTTTLLHGQNFLHHHHHHHHLSWSLFFRTYSGLTCLLD